MSENTTIFNFRTIIYFSLYKNFKNHMTRNQIQTLHKKTIVFIMIVQSFYLFFKICISWFYQYRLINISWINYSYRFYNIFYCIVFYSLLMTSSILLHIFFYFYPYFLYKMLYKFKRSIKKRLFNILFQIHSNIKNYKSVNKIS